MLSTQNPQSKYYYSGLKTCWVCYHSAFFRIAGLCLLQCAWCARSKNTITDFSFDWQDTPKWLSLTCTNCASAYSMYRSTTFNIYTSWMLWPVPCWHAYVQIYCLVLLTPPPISHPPIGSAARHSSTRTACPEHRPLSFTAVPLSPSHKKTSMWWRYSLSTKGENWNKYIGAWVGFEENIIYSLVRLRREITA